MADLTIPFPTEATRLARTHAIPRIIEDQKFVKTIWIYEGRDIIINTGGEEETKKSRMGRGRWVTNVCNDGSELRLDLEQEIDMTDVMLRPISFEFSMSRALHCW